MERLECDFRLWGWQAKPYLGVSQFGILELRKAYREGWDAWEVCIDVAHSTHSYNFVVSVNSDALKLSCEYLRLFVVGELQTLFLLCSTLLLKLHCKSFYVFQTGICQTNPQWTNQTPWSVFCRGSGESSTGSWSWRLHKNWGNSFGENFATITPGFLGYIDLTPK